MALLSRRIVLQALAAQALGGGRATGQAQAHRKPKPLRAGAVTDDWPSFLGPSHNAVSAETRLSRTLAAAAGLGVSQRAPATRRRRSRAGAWCSSIASANEEIVECLHPETGASHWQFRYATEFEDRYGYNNGPRASPVDRRRPRVHGRRRREAALPGACDRERRSGSGICARSTRCRRISSAPPRRRWWKAGC